MFEYHQFLQKAKKMLTTGLQKVANFRGNFDRDHPNIEAIHLNDQCILRRFSSLFSTSTVCSNMKQSILRLFLPRILLTGFVWIASTCEKIVGFRRNPVDKTSKLGPPNPESTPKPLQASKDLDSVRALLCEGNSTQLRMAISPKVPSSKINTRETRMIANQFWQIQMFEKNQANSTISGGEATQHGKLSLEA